LGQESTIFAAGAGAVVAHHQRDRFDVPSVVFTGAIAPTSDHDLVFEVELGDRADGHAGDLARKSGGNIPHATRSKRSASSWLLPRKVVRPGESGLSAPSSSMKTPRAESTRRSADRRR
jgi:hypothetical protein